VTVIDILIKYREGFLSGLVVTLKLCLIIWAIGIIVGLSIGVASSKWKKAVGIPARFLSFLLSGFPVLVLLFWFHYPMQEIFDVVIDPFLTSVTTLSIINVFAVADLVRKVMQDFPEQYITAARVCGLQQKQIMLKIQFPIVFRQILPGLLIIQVNMLQMTLFASLISVDEIFRVAQRINSQIYRPVEIYSALGMFFLAVCLPLNGLAAYLRNRFTRDLSER
jgi:His/Glu/Gln/Arg/opine family amino acid ABC transporter permease subunit